MNKKIKSDINWILTTIGYKKSEVDYYVKYEAETQMIDLADPSKEEIQSILQELILETGKRRLGFSLEENEEPQYVLMSIKGIVPNFDYKNFKQIFYLNGKQVDYNPVDVDNDFELEVSFSIGKYKFKSKYYDLNYIKQLISEINREILIPMFKVRIYQLMNENELGKFVLFPSSIEPEEFSKYSDYL